MNNNKEVSVITLGEVFGLLWNAIWFIAFTIGAIVMAVKSQGDSFIDRILGVGACAFLAIIFSVLTIGGFIQLVEQRRKS